ncbi:MAG: hypothetical protein SVM80_11735 [Halobacteriota archaeon]|nr:hypothetical protein [Halobacteriota archaeon]
MAKVLKNTYSSDGGQLSNSAVYHRIYRKVKNLIEIDALHAIDPCGNPKVFETTPNGLDLLCLSQNSNSRKKYDEIDFMRTSYQRKKSAKLLTKCKLASEELHGEPVRDLIQDEFEDYLEEIQEKTIILKKRDDGLSTAGFPEWKFINYETRFNSEKKQKRQYAVYHNLFDNATKGFRFAVHLVLTTDPKRFPNLWEANRHFSQALNRFFSYLKKRSGSRPKYICAYEFTKTGLLHAHIIIFGKKYLLPHRQITAEWERCGQGSYNYIYSLVNDNSNWVYSREKPKDIKKGETARDYLIKYVAKAMKDPVSMFFYWAFNKRFFTYSRCLYTRTSPRLIPLHIYRFFGVYYHYDLPHCIEASSTPCEISKPPPKFNPEGIINA